MNKTEADILDVIIENNHANQRELARKTNYSLGTVNKTLKTLQNDGYITSKVEVTNKTKELIKYNKPQNAIILAAGYGMRMVPINSEVPKALLEVNNETLIERIIKQLKDVGVNDIYVVVGYMKEQFEFLIDEYNVKLIFNSYYSKYNNFYSLYLAKELLNNTYIIPCDIWCKDNPFHNHEFYSWYMINDSKTDNSMVRLNKKEELVLLKDDEIGNTMIGISYLTSNDCLIVKERLDKYVTKNRYLNSYWEDVLISNNKFFIKSKKVPLESVIEINTYEQLREIDENSNQLKNDAIDIICHSLNVANNDIKNIFVLKKGMTNRSFIFECHNQKYIMRIPGEGTDFLINRNEEANVYNVIKDKSICDEIIYINPSNGYKITKYIDDTRTCNPSSQDDLVACMNVLRQFHQMKLTVSHYFDIFEKINYYESLWLNPHSIYRDYKQTKTNIFKLKTFIDTLPKELSLTHIDAVPDNFLFVENSNEKIFLIDWEYASMQDPHVDIAMFCIYALYDKSQIDNLIDLYFNNQCDRKTRLKIYSYIAVCGLLWSNWCEYKRQLGIEFGEYALKQYRYAKEFYKTVEEEIEVFNL